MRTLNLSLRRRLGRKARAAMNFKIRIGLAIKLSAATGLNGLVGNSKRDAHSAGYLRDARELASDVLKSKNGMLQSQARDLLTQLDHGGELAQAAPDDIAALVARAENRRTPRSDAIGSRHEDDNRRQRDQTTAKPRPSRHRSMNCMTRRRALRKMLKRRKRNWTLPITTSRPIKTHCRN